jgi:hypothetical protein
MRLRTLLIGIGLLATSVASTRAESVLGAQVGAGYIPMSDWEDFAGPGYEQDRLGLFTEVWFTSRVSHSSAFRFALEWITTSSWEAVSVGGFSDVVVEWDFQTIPFSVSYEHTLRRAGVGALTLVGAGVGYYMSEVTGKVSGDINPSSATRDGDGYGIHAYLRQTALIADRLSLSGMIRGRWADGMAFDDNDGDVPVEFSGVDVSLGLEWRID